MDIKEIIESAPESGFAVPWIKERCELNGIKITRNEILQTLKDFGYVKTRLWHKPRVNAYSNSIK